MPNIVPVVPSVIETPFGDVPIRMLTQQEAEELGCDKDNGWWDPNARYVGIQTSSPAIVQLRAIMHEKAHVWFDEWEIEFPKDPDGANRLEERACTIVGNMLCYEELLRQQREQAEVNERIQNLPPWEK